MFDIAFDTDGVEFEDAGQLVLRGSLRLGTDVEPFVAPLSLWARRDYEAQWRAAARHLLTSNRASTAFVTAAGEFCWPAWRTDAEIVLREVLLIPESGFNLAAPHEDVPARSSVPEDGYHVSEWRVALRDIEEYLARTGPA